MMYEAESTAAEISKSIMDFGSAWFEGGLIMFLVRSAFYLLFAKVVIKLIDKGISRTDRKNGAKESTSFHFLHNFLSALIKVLAVFAILSGITPLASIGKVALGASSILTVIIGLAAQEAFGNFVSGFFLAVTHPFQVGDLIALPEKDLSGTVIEITMRHTILNTAENSHVIIPNSIMNTAVIEDRAFNQSQYTKWVTVGVAYDTDLDLAKKLISEAVMEDSGFIDIRSEEEKENGDPAVKIRVEDFEASDILLKFRVVSHNVSESLETCSRIRQSILKKFNDHGITIPFQTISVINETNS